MRAESDRGAPTPFERALGVEFRDPTLRDLALTHRSYAFEESLPVHNERLELLGGDHDWAFALGPGRLDALSAVPTIVS
ncbi:MAG: hypothetical protein ACKO8G_00200, partial [Actinomycetota bacterium]